MTLSGIKAPGHNEDFPESFSTEARTIVVEECILDNETIEKDDLFSVYTKHKDSDAINEVFQVSDDGESVQLTQIATKYITHLLLEKSRRMIANLKGGNNKQGTIHVLPVQSQDEENDDPQKARSGT